MDDVEKGLNDMIQQKRNNINKAIQGIKPLIGKPMISEIIVPMFVVIATNLEELYQMNQLLFTAVINLKKQVDSKDDNHDNTNMQKSITNITRHVEEIRKDYDKTLGSLQDVIKKIKDREGY